MFDFSYSNILHSNLINFLIMFGLFVAIFVLMDVPKKIKDAANNVKNDIEKSHEDKEKSEMILKETEKKLKNAEKETKKILNEANQVSENFMSSALNEAEGLVENIKQDYEKIYEREVFKIKKGMAFDISNKSLQKSTEKLKEMFKSKEFQEKYLNSAIKELEGIDLRTWN